MSRRRDDDWIREAILPADARGTGLLRLWCRLWGWSWAERPHRRTGGRIVELRRPARLRDGRLRTGLWQQIAADRATGGLLWDISEFHGPLPPRPLRRHLTF